MIIMTLIRIKHNRNNINYNAEKEKNVTFAV